MASGAERSAKWRRNNPDAARAAQERYEKAHPGRKQVVAAKWTKANPLRARAAVNRWAKQNRATTRALQKAREARKLKAVPAWYNKEDVAAMYRLCNIFKKTSLDLQVDHVVPLVSDFVSGLHCLENLQLLHKYENQTKSNRFWPDMTEYAKDGFRRFKDAAP